MKKIKKIKLNRLNEKQLEKKQMSVLKGGCSCSCSANCSCSSYPPGGMPNSMNNSDFFNYWNEGTNNSVMTG